MFQLSFFHARFPLCIETPVSLETTTSRSFFHMAQSRNIFNTATPTKRKQQDFVLGENIGECVKAACTSLRVRLCFNSLFFTLARFPLCIETPVPPPVDPSSTWLSHATSSTPPLSPSASSKTSFLARILESVCKQPAPVSECICVSTLGFHSRFPLCVETPVPPPVIDPSSTWLSHATSSTPPLPPSASSKTSFLARRLESV